MSTTKYTKIFIGGEEQKERKKEGQGTTESGKRIGGKAAETCEMLTWREESATESGKSNGEQEELVFANGHRQDVSGVTYVIVA